MSGTEYIGTLAETQYGKNCQRWDQQEPHTHLYSTSNYFPDATIADASNYCRNPEDWSGGLWCFTTDPQKQWEPCDIKFCQTSKLTLCMYYSILCM